MKKQVFKIMDSLFTKSENPKALYALQKMFALGIPFNKPHGLNFLMLTRNESRFRLANKRLNHNHLGGMHAIAQCLIGEFSAGILLSKNFPTLQYRLIMKDLNAVYFKQARSEIYGSAIITDDQIEQLKETIICEDKADMTLKTTITNSSGEKVSEVTTTWQLKDWTKAKFK